MMFLFVLGAVIAGFAMGDTFLESVGFAVVVWFVINVIFHALFMIVSIWMEMTE